jgi:hypothetical protein
VTSTIRVTVATALMTAATVSAVQPSGPDVPEHGREYLRGLPGIVLDRGGSLPSDDPVAKVRLNGQIRSNTELSLRQWGIRVLETGDATLGMTWAIGPRERDSYSMVVSLGVSERMRSVATGRIWRLSTYQRGEVWKKAFAARCEEESPPCVDLLRQHVKDNIDVFIADWLKVNPTKVGPPRSKG